MESDYCLGCKNYIVSGQCLAFPDGIPELIFTGQQDHSKPIEGQENEIVFEPIEQ